MPFSRWRRCGVYGLAMPRIWPSPSRLVRGCLELAALAAAMTLTYRDLDHDWATLAGMVRAGLCLAILARGAAAAMLIAAGRRSRKASQRLVSA
jgi:hypothetical protein